MRSTVLLFIAVLAGCAAPPEGPSLNQAPGRFKDFADYMLAVDPEIMKDAATHGATREQAHCAAETMGRNAHGIYYDQLSAAVSGQRQISAEDARRAQQREQRYISTLLSDKAVGRQVMENFWTMCMKA